MAGAARRRLVADTGREPAAADAPDAYSADANAPRRFPRSTTTRIALIVFLGLVISSAIILGFIARVTQGQLDADAGAMIVAERDAVIEMFGRDGAPGAAAVITAELRIPGPLVMLLAAPDGRPLAGNIGQWPAGLVADNRFGRRALVRAGSSGSEPFAVTAAPLSGGFRLMVGRSLAEEERLTDTLATSLVAAIGVAVLLALAISFVLTRTIAARVQSIADVAAAVAGGDLSRRVSVPDGSGGDAFDSMGAALNAMLARIEALLDELRSVTDGLAHDLRSPLTRMKARIDRLARSGSDQLIRSGSDQLIRSGSDQLLRSGSDPGTPDIDFAGAPVLLDPGEVAAIGHEADALLAMLDNSLEISRLEAGIGRDAFRHIDLAALVTDMAEMYEPLADDNGVRLTALAALPVPVLAHRELLGRALSNLIDNALRHGASGGMIEIEAAPTATGARLSVADHGPGIVRTSRAEALRRFGRLDAARSQGGAGLGLSLAAAIARLHGGELTLSGNNPGLRVTIDLPGGTERP